MNNLCLNQKDRIIILLALFFIITNCEKASLDYLSEIPNIESYEYVEIGDWKDIAIDTVTVGKIYEAKSDTQATISRIGFIEEINYSLLWIADPLRGKVVELNTNSKTNVAEEVLDNGKGPNEVVRPSSIFFDGNADSIVYILDSGQSCILEVDNHGAEVKRRCLSNIPNTSISVYFKIIGEDEYLWSTNLDEEFVVGEFDSLGNLNKGLVPRLIPMGFQPITYNQVVFDREKESSLFVFSYKGLPLIFIEIDGEKKVLNLWPDKNIADFNVQLEKKNESTNISVKNIIRDIYITEGKIYVSLLTSLLVIDLNQTEVTRKYTFKNNENLEVKFHMFKVKKNNVYVVDQYHNDIYSISVDSLLN